MGISNNFLVQQFLEQTGNEDICKDEYEIDKQLSEQLDKYKKQRNELYFKYLEKIENTITKIGEQLNDNKFMVSLLGRYVDCDADEHKHTFGQIVKVVNPIQNQIVGSQTCIEFVLRPLYSFDNNNVRFLEQFHFRFDLNSAYTSKPLEHTIKFISKDEYETLKEQYTILKNKLEEEERQNSIKEEQEQKENMKLKEYKGVKYFSNMESVELFEE